MIGSTSSLTHFLQTLFPVSKLGAAVMAVFLAIATIGTMVSLMVPAMIFQRLNRTDAETVFMIMYNVAGAQITAGYAAVWDTATADGIRVTKPATATLSLLVGLSNRDLADSSYGLFQAYGYRASGFVTNDTSQAIAAGDILIPVNAQHYLTRSAASDGKTGFVYAGQSFATATTPAAANKNLFIRCL